MSCTFGPEGVFSDLALALDQKIGVLKKCLVLVLVCLVRPVQLQCWHYEEDRWRQVILESPQVFLYTVHPVQLICGHQRMLKVL